MKYLTLSLLILLSSCTGTKYDDPGSFEPRAETVRIQGCEDLKARSPGQADC